MMKLLKADGEVLCEVVAAEYSMVRGGWETSIGFVPDPDKALVVAQGQKLSPIQFKLLFTAQERIEIKRARATDSVIDDFCELVEDPRLTHVDLGLASTGDAIAYLQAKGLLSVERAHQILGGELF